MEEDRNCNCQETNNMKMQMNINSYDCNNCNDTNMTRKEMLKKIKCLKFAVTELALYLDTHPDDKKALCLHNKYSFIAQKYKKIVKETIVFDIFCIFAR